MERNNTTFPIKLNAYLKQLYDDYVLARGDAENPEHKYAAFLHYYQYLCRELMKNNVVKSRGFLAHIATGFGKSIIAVSIANAVKSAKVIVLEPQTLHNNFKDNAALYAEKTDDSADFTFVTSNAYNTGDKFALMNIDNSLIIVDEAHILFKAIINSQSKTNARKIYDKIMASRGVRLLFLTATPISKNPFELVPCFNMLAGADLFPTSYSTFCELYIKDGHMINREKFMNRIVGLVSHVEHGLPSEPGSRSDSSATEGQKKARDDGWFPEDLGTEILNIPMSEPQYQQYMLYRFREDQEAKRAAKRASKPRPLSLPNDSSMSSYYVRSRMCGLFCPQADFLHMAVQDMPIECFTDYTSPKCKRVAQMVTEFEFKSIVYCPFVEMGLNVLGRFLEIDGMELLTIDELQAIDVPETTAAATEAISDETITDINIENELEDGDAASTDIDINGELIQNNDLKANTIKNSKTDYDPSDAESITTYTGSAGGIAGSLERKNAIRLVKFEKNICEQAYDKNSQFFIDPKYNEIERDIIRDVVSQDLDARKFREYNPSFKIPKGFKYRSDKGERDFITTLHQGQRKLFLQEVQLFNATMKSNLDYATVLYAGAAPGVHLKYLATLFPNVLFILWDPAPFFPELEKLPNFVIHSEYFTNEVASSYNADTFTRGDDFKNHPKHAHEISYFICDIRLVSDNFEAQVHSDMKAQAIWTARINPIIGSMLKCRFPYIDEDAKNIEYKYMKGTIIMQTWPSKSSTETRLITLRSDGYEMNHTYDNVHYQDYCAYHNMIIRCWVTFDLGLNDKTFPVDGFDRCFDCANEYNTWSDYIKLAKSQEPISNYMNTLTRVIEQRLISNKSLHGYYNTQPLCKRRERLYTQFKDGILKITGKSYAERDHPEIQKLLDDRRDQVGDEQKIDDEIKGGSGASRYKYFILSGDISDEDRRKLKAVYNSSENDDGHIIKCLLMSDVGATGLDLKTTCMTIQLLPNWSSTIERQFRARAIRMGSHDRLPKEQRQVKSYMVIATANEKLHKEIIEKEAKTIDEQFYADSKKAEILNDEFTAALIPVCFECSLFNYESMIGEPCRVCNATDRPLFSNNPLRDISEPDACVIYKERTEEVKMIKYDNREIYYKEDPARLTGYILYIYDPTIRSYTEYTGEDMIDIADAIDELK